MFTGIIENTGVITDSISSGNNISFWIESTISDELTIDQSVSHNGVCLTVEQIRQGQHKVTAIQETRHKTNLNHWKKKSVINLERCLQMNGRLDGHLVQGHVDSVATCSAIAEKQGSWEYTFSFDPKIASLLIEKGSVTINGISLTLFDMQHLVIGDEVNIEFDMIGKYINRIMELKK